jgi:hypothetical protein
MSQESEFDPVWEAELVRLMDEGSKQMNSASERIRAVGVLLDAALEKEDALLSTNRALFATLCGETAAIPPVDPFRNVNLNDARDKFIYEQRVAGVQLKTILKGVNETKGWSKLESAQSVYEALKRYCERYGLTIPIRKHTKIKRD